MVEINTTVHWKEEIYQMCETTEKILQIVHHGLTHHNLQLLTQAEDMCKQIHLKEKELTELLVKLVPKEKEAKIFLPIPGHLERIGDELEQILGYTRSKIHDGIPFTDRAMNELAILFKDTSDLLINAKDCLVTKNKVLIRYIQQEAERVIKLANTYATFHEERLITGECLSKASSLYLAILDSFKGIISHVEELSQRAVGNNKVV